MKQIGNVAALPVPRATAGNDPWLQSRCKARPGIVKYSIGLPATWLQQVRLSPRLSYSIFRTFTVDTALRSETSLRLTWVWTFYGGVKWVHQACALPCGACRGVQVFQKLLFLLAVLGSISTARSFVPTPSQSDFRRRQLEPFSGGVRLVRTNLLYSDVQPVKASDVCTHLNPGPAV